MKKTQIAGILFSALLLSAFEQAVADQASDNTSAPMMRMDQMGMAPKCDNQKAWNLNADFLWWTANFNAISDVDVDIDDVKDMDARVHLKRPGASWDPGVRIALGWNTGYDNWDLQGMWTFFYNSTEHHEGSKFRFRYNAADVELGKAFYVSPNFFIRPFTGIHAIWTSVRTSLTLDVDSLLESSTLIATPFDNRVRTDAGAWGVGPRIGLNTNWGNFKGFSLLANISGSLVYGKHLDKAKTAVEVPTGTVLGVSFRDREYWELMPTMQIQYGFSYACCFGKERYQFRINTMWESNFIWEAANVLVFDKSISMNGLTVDFGFIF